MTLSLFHPLSNLYVRGNTYISKSIYFFKSLIIDFITMKIIPTEITQRINANKAFVVTKKVQTLKTSLHGHSKKLISSYPYTI